MYSLMDPAAGATRSLAPVLERTGIPVEMLGASRLRHAWRVERRLVAHWRSWRPDVVQTFLFHANVLGRIAARRAGVSHVVCGIRVAEPRSRLRLRVDRWTDRLVVRQPGGG